MNYVKLNKQISDKKEEFSKAKLLEAFKKEEATTYVGEQRKPGYIRHVGVSQILAQFMSDYQTKQQRKEKYK